MAAQKSGVVAFRGGGGGTRRRVAECREDGGAVRKCGKDYEKAELKSFAEAKHYPASQSFLFQRPIRGQADY